MQPQQSAHLFLYEGEHNIARGGGRRRDDHTAGRGRAGSGNLRRGQNNNARRRSSSSPRGDRNRDNNYRSRDRNQDINHGRGGGNNRNNDRSPRGRSRSPPPRQRSPRDRSRDYDRFGGGGGNNNNRRQRSFTPSGPRQRGGGQNGDQRRRGRSSSGPRGGGGGQHYNSSKSPPPQRGRRGGNGINSPSRGRANSGIGQHNFGGNTGGGGVGTNRGGGFYTKNNNPNGNAFRGPYGTNNGNTIGGRLQQMNNRNINQRQKDPFPPVRKMGRKRSATPIRDRGYRNVRRQDYQPWQWGNMGGGGRDHSRGSSSERQRSPASGSDHGSVSRGQSRSRSPVGDRGGAGGDNTAGGGEMNKNSYNNTNARTRRNNKNNKTGGDANASKKRDNNRNNKNGAAATSTRTGSKAPPASKTNHQNDPNRPFGSAWMKRTAQQLSKNPKPNKSQQTTEENAQRTDDVNKVYRNIRRPGKNGRLYPGMQPAPAAPSRAGTKTTAASSANEAGGGAQNSRRGGAGAGATAGGGGNPKNDIRNSANLRGNNGRNGTANRPNDEQEESESSSSEQAIAELIYNNLNITLEKPKAYGFDRRSEAQELEDGVECGKALTHPTAGILQDQALEHFDYKKNTHIGLSKEWQVGKHLGDGTWGRVVTVKYVGEKLPAANNIQRNTWYAAKVIRVGKRERDEAIVEASHLTHIQWEGLKLPDINDCGKHRLARLVQHFDDNQFSEGIRHVMVFERLGMSLYELLSSNRFRGFYLTDIQRVMLDVLKGLSFLKDCRCAHTDMKPENIMFEICEVKSRLPPRRCREHRRYGPKPENPEVTREDGSPLAWPDGNYYCVSGNYRVKIIDFGATEFFPGPGETDEDYDTKPMIIATRQYRSPEILIAAKWNYAVDVFAVGAIACEMYSGDQLFQNDKDYYREHLMQHQVCCGPFSTEFLNRGMKEIVDKHFLHDPYEHACANFILQDPEGSGTPEKTLKACRYVKDCKPDPLNTLEDTILDDEDHRFFVQFLRRALTLDPTYRPTAQMLLGEPFFRQALPEDQ
ncbi:unnamed protein product [Amoebophrya sp. A120]|nr:unnamed protein product [Amoebophrya sp. A120]|eukprot:GSA120T00014965001.1